MAQTDSQRPEFEDPESSNSSSDLTDAQIDGSAVDKGPLSEDESFQSSVGEMLDSIETESAEEEDSGDGVSDASGAESEVPQIDPSDELLIRAGSILNGGETDIPEPEEEIEIEEEDAEGLLDFPDPQSLLAEVREQEQDQSEEAQEDLVPNEDSPDESEGLVSMPDPQSLMKEASDDVQIAPNENPATESVAQPSDESKGESEQSLEEAPSENEDLLEVAEEPVEAAAETFDSEPVEDETEDNVVAEEPEIAREPEPEPEAAKESEASESTEISEADDPVADDDDDLLFDDDAGDDLFSDSESGFSIKDDDDDIDGASTESAGSSVDSSQADSGRLARARKYITWSVAASLAFVGLSILGSSFKDPILDLLAHGDIQETRIHRVVAHMTEKVFDSVNHGQPYDLAWIESEIQRVSDEDFRVAAKIGVRLQEDLYRPLEDSYAYALLPFSKSQLEEATAFANDSRELPSGLQSPNPGWAKLYKRDGKKGEIYDFDAHYRITVNGVGKSGWELSNLRINGNDGGLAWASMLPKSELEEGSVEVDSLEFNYYLRAFEKSGLAFLEEAKAYKEIWIASQTEKAERLQRLRRELIMSLSQGSYFKGIAILGETSEETRDVSLIVTETRGEGELIKGLLKLEDESVSAKHFTGVLDIVEQDEGIQGRLELTTIAFAGQPHDTPDLAFFKPGTVSRIQMSTDGRSLEGDSDSLSLRLMRGR